MWKYAALMSYQGTPYCGWQKQKNPKPPHRQSIQQVLEEKLVQIVQEPTSVVGSGRTDAGVHALGQVAHFTLKNKSWEPAKLKNGLNSLLPASIRILSVLAVPSEFHAQRSTFQKQYSFYFLQGPSDLPYLHPYSLWIRAPLNLKAMQESVACLEGTHDFVAFQSSGSKKGVSTVRTIYRVEVARQKIDFPGPTDFGTPSPMKTEGGSEPYFFVRLTVVGSGFLKQMVRGIAGTLLDVGEGKKSPERFQEILKTQDRRLLGATAAPRGLWLERVDYPPEFGLQWIC